MSLLPRKSNGEPLRRAIKASGLSIPKLAAATKEVDETGRGVSHGAIGMLANEAGKSARQRCRIRTAWLIAEALNQPLQKLFDMPEASTSTKERSTPDEREHASAPPA
jgi:hypothetical protein